MNSDRQRVSSDTPLQPSLRVRLMDDAPERRYDREHERTLHIETLRTNVIEDLEALLNTTPLEATQPGGLAQLPELRRSVVNYGFADLSGRPLSELMNDKDQLQRTLVRVIRNFEPRLNPDSLDIEILGQRSLFDPAGKNDPQRDELDDNALVFWIKADLWAQPDCQPLRLKTAVDLESGSVVITDETDSQLR